MRTITVWVVSQNAMQNRGGEITETENDNSEIKWGKRAVSGGKAFVKV